MFHFKVTGIFFMQLVEYNNTFNNKIWSGVATLFHNGAVFGYREILQNIFQISIIQIFTSPGQQSPKTFSRVKNNLIFSMRPRKQSQNHYHICIYSNIFTYFIYCIVTVIRINIININKVHILDSKTSKQVNQFEILISTITFYA